MCTVVCNFAQSWGRELKSLQTDEARYPFQAGKLDAIIWSHRMEGHVTIFDELELK